MTKDKPPLEEMTLRQLRKVASAFNVSRYSRMRKDQLLAAILEAQKNADGLAGSALTHTSFSYTIEEQEDVEATKFDLGQDVFTNGSLASVDAGLPELPNGYDQSCIVLMPRDPQWAYAYWDIPNEAKAILRAQGGQQLALRLYDVTNVQLGLQTSHSIQEYSCDELARNWYLPIPVSDRDYVIEIGYRCADGRWLLLARSQSVRVPPVYPSEWIEDRYVTIAWDEDLTEKTFLNVVPGLSPMMSPIYDEMAAIANRDRVAGSVTGSGQMITGSGQMVTGSGQMVTGSGQMVTGSGQMVTGSGQMITGSGQMVTGSGQMVTGSGLMVTGSGQMVTGSGQMITGSAQMITGSGQMITGSAQMITGSAQMIPGSAQMVTGSAQMITGSGQMITGSAQMIPGSAQMVTGSAQMITGSGQMITGSAQMIPGSAQMITGSGQMITGSAQMIPGSAQMITGSGQMIPGSAQMITGSGQMVPGSAQMGLSSYVFPSGVGIWAGVPNVSGLTMSGVGFSASAPPIRPRQFWLVADAELIVYGATEPDANVTIGGKPITLNPDGTFRFQMSFQDGVIDFPILAVAVDGEQSRSVHMKFERETLSRNTNTKADAVVEWLKYPSNK